jgi:hypothetical protein
MGQSEFSNTSSLTVTTFSQPRGCDAPAGRRRRGNLGGVYSMGDGDKKR